MPPIRRRRHSLDIGELQVSRTLARAGSAHLNRELNYYVPPVNLTRQLSTPNMGLRDRIHRVSSASNDRAKMGFKYWTDDNKGTGHEIKKTIGSRGTFLGLGIARL